MTVEKGNSTAIIDNNDKSINDLSEVTKPSFQELNDIRFEKAAEKVEAILYLVRNTNRQAKDIEAAAQKLGKSKRTIFRWIKRYMDFGGPEGLLTPKNFGGSGIGRISLEAEAIFEEQFSTVYLNAQKPSVAAFYNQYEATCQKLGLKAPSYYTIRRRIRSKNEQLIVKERQGLEAFKKRFQVSGGTFNEKTFPLQTIMIDHTDPDLILLDHAGIEIGRPYITIAMDVYSRCIWGYYLGFQKPNADIVGSLIRMGSFRKDDLIAKFHLSEWPIFGCPNQIHTDNAKEFTSRALREGCIANEIHHIRRPVKRPEYGAYIERFFRTLADKLVHLLPGTTFSNVQQKGKYNSQKKAVLNIDDFEEFLLRFIVDEYHNTVHRSLDMTPLQKWKEGLKNSLIVPQEPKDEERFKQDFLCLVPPDGRRVIERDGIHFNDLVYYAPELGVLKRYDGKKHKKHMIRYDPTDLSSLYLFDEDRNRYYKLLLKSRPTIPLSLREIKSCKQSLKRQGMPRPKEVVVINAILQKQEHIRNLTTDNRRTRRKAAAERRTQELKNRLSTEIASAGDETPKTPRKFRPELIDVDSVEIVSLDGKSR